MERKENKFNKEMRNKLRNLKKQENCCYCFIVLYELSYLKQGEKNKYNEKINKLKKKQENCCYCFIILSDLLSYIKQGGKKYLAAKSICIL